MWVDASPGLFHTFRKASALEVAEWLTLGFGAHMGNAGLSPTCTD